MGFRRYRCSGQKRGIGGRLDLKSRGLNRSCGFDSRLGYLERLCTFVRPRIPRKSGEFLVSCTVPYGPMRASAAPLLRRVGNRLLEVGIRRLEVMLIRDRPGISYPVADNMRREDTERRTTAKTAVRPLA
jgi:hypothetical protein